MDQKPAAPPPRSIRLAALLVAVMMGFAGAAASLRHGNTRARAADGGLIAGIASLTAWGAYHLVSRKQNGIITMVLPMTIFTNSLSQNRETDPAPILFQAVFIGLFTGLLIRATDCLLLRAEKPTAADHSMADAGLDAPPSSSISDSSTV